MLNLFKVSSQVLLLCCVFAVTLGSGCSDPSVEESCNSFCEDFGACSPTTTPEDIAECKADCAADISAGDVACQDAIDDLAGCVSGATCDELDSGSACQGEFSALSASCPVN